uniref:Uncharacterized protein n=1 Tax=Salix viminalis TaxID=40686 RepID=A0A6N2NG09_SALVM
MSTGPLPLFVFLRRLMGLVVVFPSQLTQNSDLERDGKLYSYIVAAWVRATGNLAGDIIIGLGAHLFEISEEENILTMDSVERVPDLERLICIEAAISNRSRGGKARVSEFGIQIEAHQFVIIRVESIARE